MPINKAQIQKEIAALQEEMKQFSPETDRYAVAQEKIEILQKQLVAPVEDKPIE